jgi:hypothetical protein
MSLLRRLAPAAVALSLLAAGPAMAAETITLTTQEAEALKLKLIQAKPNLNTVTLFSFLAPGSGQAYMGHIDRSFVLWGGYLLGFTAIKLAVPDGAVATAGGPKTSDLAVTGLFIGIAAASALDAYLLALKERQEYDAYINRLTERTRPTP